jgi:hypothetical protein
VLVTDIVGVEDINGVFVAVGGVPVTVAVGDGVSVRKPDGGAMVW